MIEIAWSGTESDLPPEPRHGPVLEVERGMEEMSVFRIEAKSAIF